MESHGYSGGGQCTIGKEPTANAANIATTPSLWSRFPQGKEAVVTIVGVSVGFVLAALLALLLVAKHCLISYQPPQRQEWSNDDRTSRAGQPRRSSPFVVSSPEPTTPTSLVMVPVVVLRGHDDGFGDITPGTGRQIHSTTTKSIRRTLRSVLDDYEREGSQALAGLSAMLEEALRSEEVVRGQQQQHWTTSHWYDWGKTTSTRKESASPWLSARIETRIKRTSACLDHNRRVLDRLLGNFSYVVALPDRDSAAAVGSNRNSAEAAGEGSPSRSSTGTARFQDENDGNGTPQSTGGSTHFTLPHRPRGGRNAAGKDTTDMVSSSYDSATQIWAHLVRDWTVEGIAVRGILYDWCVEQVDSFCHRQQQEQKQRPPSPAKVLVPGAGMGRLAYELFLRGYSVEANEVSPSMAAAAASVLRNQLHDQDDEGDGGLFFHPYVLDGMANEVDSQRRFDVVRFPDVVPTFGTTTTCSSSSNISSCGSLSYTVGSFVGTDDEYYQRQRVGQFDAIVTCFFIDTATNIYEYLETIRALLRPGSGVWINVGPVQWHHNAVLRPSVDELQDLLEAAGWILRHWSIDSVPVSYRDEASKKSPPRMTSYDGYHPLRFVATRSAL